MATNTTSAEKTTHKLGGRLTDTVDPTLDRQVREKLVTARIGLLLRAPFFGNLATRLSLVNADDWLTTAATDGRNFYYNTEFVNKLKPKEVEFLFGHEVLHNVYDHMGRVGETRDKRLFNCAADYCVNADLIEQKIGDKITPCLYDPKYKGWSAEEVYDDLYDKAEKIDISDLLQQVLDEHLDGEGAGEGDGDGDEKDGNGRPRLSKEERDRIKDEIREALLQAAQAVGAGNLPAGVKRLIKDLTKPVVNWRELLEQQIQSTVKDDFSWMRPNRRSWHMDAIMPGMKPGTQIDVCVAIDTSGSISEQDLKDFLSEVKGIMESYDEYKIRVITWDTDVYNPAEYSNENMEDITEYQPGGGGGTDPHCVWEWLKENDIEPKKLIMFTDFCFFGWRPDEVKDYCDTVWVIKGNKDAEPEFGVWAHYEEAKKLARV
jgi:predicted metal-dependent peptidase